MMPLKNLISKILESVSSCSHEHDQPEPHQSGEGQYLERRTYQRVIRDGQRVINQQNEQIRQISRNASDAIRFNLLIVVAVLSVATIVVQLSGAEQGYSIPVDRFANAAIWVGFGLSFFSLIAAIWAITRSERKVGLSHNDIDMILDQEYQEMQFLHDLTRSLTDWIEFNAQSLFRDATHLFASYLLMLMAIGSYGLAVLWAFFGETVMTFYLYLGIGIILIGFPFIGLLPYSRFEKHLSAGWSQFVSNFDWLYGDDSIDRRERPKEKD